MSVVNSSEPFPTAELRWVPKSMMQAADMKLQQLYRRTVTDRNGHVHNEPFEWRDVAVVSNPDSN